MTKTRLEAFSDGVLAIIITIMVLELRPPHSSQWFDIQPLIPIFASYVMSFIFIGIYWGNHHHLLHTVHNVDSKIIWANLHLLFWLSLIPFVTAWIGETRLEPLPVAVYAADMLMCGFAFTLLQGAIMRSNQMSKALEEALKKQAKKGLISMMSYATAIFAVLIHPAISQGLIVFVAILWLIPDRNIEKALAG